MNFLNQIKTRLAALFRKRELDAEMDEELRSHIESRTQANIEVGMNPEEARFAALRQFGWTESIKEDCREQRGVRWLENLAQDIRYGARQLRKNPGFTAVAVLTLALGIGTNTAMFTVFNGLLFRPVPVPDPESVVRLHTTDQSGSFPRPPVVSRLSGFPRSERESGGIGGVRAGTRFVSRNRREPVRER